MAQLPLAQVPADMDWRWQEQAACRDSDLALFFHPVNARGRSRLTREASAKQVCGGCQVRLECLDYAIRAREPYGVWGGLTESEREQLFERLGGFNAGRRPGEGLAEARRLRALPA